MESMRSCIACRIRESSQELLRTVVVQGQVSADPLHRLPGRGAWIHPQCFQIAQARQSFRRAFRLNENPLTESLEKYLQEDARVSNPEHLKHLKEQK